jgi:hypothetical protein
MKFLLVYALALLGAPGILATTIKVGIDSDQGSKEVAKSVAARLQGTERYAFTASKDAELYLALSCIEDGEASSSNGYTCSFVVGYYPDKLAPLHARLGPWLIKGADVTSLAEKIFATFVAGTTADKLERAQKDLRSGVIGYCHGSVLDQTMRADCGQNATK